jgi:hypothetical protein
LLQNQAIEKRLTTQPIAANRDLGARRNTRGHEHQDKDHRKMASEPTTKKRRSPSFISFAGCLHESPPARALAATPKRKGGPRWQLETTMIPLLRLCISDSPFVLVDQVRALPQTGRAAVSATPDLSD